jgi:hypothetical protein
MASAAPAQSKLKPPVQSAKQQAPKVQASKHQTSVAHAGLEDTDDSSWGDGSSTEEVCRSSLCLWHAFLFCAAQQAQHIIVQDITADIGPIADDGDDAWEDVEDAVVPSQPNRFRSKKK